MSEHHERAVRDVAEAWDQGVIDVEVSLRLAPRGFIAYVVSQRERVLELETSIRDFAPRLDDKSWRIVSRVLPELSA